MELNIPGYPRRNWRVGIWLTTALLSAGIVFGYGIPVGQRIVAVTSAQTAAENTANANHFWRMLAGDAPLDSSDLGRLAAATRDLADDSNPIGALMRRYVGPGELPDVGDTLGFHAFERTDPHDASKKVTDGGHFTDTFILRTIQATGQVDGSSVDDLIRPVPPVPSYGWLRWEWGAGAVASVLAIASLLALWLRRDRRRWPARARARALAELTDDQREVLGIIEGLERQACSEDRDKLLWQAKALFREMEEGLTSRAQANRDKLAELRTALEDKQESWQLQRVAYEELPRGDAPPAG